MIVIRLYPRHIADLKAVKQFGLGAIEDLTFYNGKRLSQHSAMTLFVLFLIVGAAINLSESRYLLVEVGDKNNGKYHCKVLIKNTAKIGEKLCHKISIMIFM